MSYYDDQLQRIIGEDKPAIKLTGGNVATDWIDLNAESIECLLAFLSAEAASHNIKVNYTIDHV